MKVSWRTELPLWLLIVTMFALALSAWPSAPDSLPVHWGLNGQVDRYGSKFEGLFLFPLVTVVLYLITLGLPRVDPGRLNYAGFAGPYTLLRFGLIGFMAALYGLMQFQIRGHHVDVGHAVFVLIGILFVLVGSVMGKIRPNWFFGIRTPWTLSSKASWVRTHRLGGWVFLIGGIVMIGTSIIPAVQIYVLLAFGAGVLWTVVYSYLVWKSDPDRIPPTGTVPREDETGGA